MESNINAANVKSAINQASAELKPDTTRFTLTEFYPGPFSGLVDKTQYGLEDLEKKDLAGMTGFSEARMKRLWWALCELEVGESYRIHTTMKTYQIVLTRVA